MKRRQWAASASALILLTSLGVARTALALTLADLSGGDASKALKAALDKGALSAIGTLGVNDGFMGNERVRIGLPGHLNDAAKLMRTFGQGDQVDALQLAMNRAAEAAVPQAKDMLLGAVQSMTVDDAKKLLAGSDTAITDFFAAKTRPGLSDKFLPVVTKATEHVGLADKYNQVAAKASNLGLIGQDEANIQKYVTGKALDGLFLLIADEEKKIRQNPMQAGSALLQKVFGAL
jgi:hypothetical protein